MTMRIALRCLLLALAVLPALVLLRASASEDFSPAERRAIAALSLSTLPPLPPDPSNRLADDPGAAALGATLFFDQRLGANGKVACATCHVIDRQFQDDLPLGKGIGTANRRTMPLAGAAWEHWYFWDGRKDSLWSQALAPLENAAEQGANRTALAQFMAKNFGQRYQRIFGLMPDLSRLPAAAGPLGSPAEQAAWAAMSEADQQAVERIFSNMGKAIEAFERALPHTETGFDRFAAALAGGGDPTAPDARLSDDEERGLKLFIGKAKCVTCHNGPRFSDGKFHNTGIPSVAGLPPDLGRQTGVQEVATDPFNCLGPFSDAPAIACVTLGSIAGEGAPLTRAYKTPSLRGVAGRPPYMHSGQLTTLDAVLDHYSRAPAAESGRTELTPLALSDADKKALIAFLKTLD